MKRYYYVTPNWQNEPLCIIYACDKGLKQAKKDFQGCKFTPCPFTESDINTLDVHTY